MEPVLRVRGLGKQVGAPSRQLFQGLTLEAHPGEMVAVCGRSGSGKSTLLNVVGGLDTEFQGEVHVAGQDLRALDDDARSALRLRTVGMVFQAFHLVEHLTLLRNVTLPARFATKEEQELARTRGMDLLKSVGLADRANQTPTSLSGGERQRVAIARALVMGPRLLLADEPTGNLDRTTADDVLKVFRELTLGAGAAVLLVTHDERIAELAHRTVRLVDGEAQVEPRRINGTHNGTGVKVS
ncbi:MAG: ABC transporter ATP-binding protein [Myxococcota bacterium]